MCFLIYEKSGIMVREVSEFSAKTMVNFAEIMSGFVTTFQCRNVTIMKNAQGDRVIIQEVK